MVFTGDKEKYRLALDHYLKMVEQRICSRKRAKKVMNDLNNTTKRRVFKQIENTIKEFEDLGIVNPMLILQREIGFSMNYLNVLILF